MRGRLFPSKRLGNLLAVTAGLLVDVFGKNAGSSSSLATVICSQKGDSRIRIMMSFAVNFVDSSFSCKCVDSPVGRGVSLCFERSLGATGAGVAVAVSPNHPELMHSPDRPRLLL